MSAAAPPATTKEASGGAGPSKNNVLILSSVPTAPGRDDEDRGEALAEIHPGLADEPSGIVLHLHSTAAGYDRWRQQRVWLASAVGSPYAFSPTVFRPQDQDEACAKRHPAGHVAQQV